MKDYIELGSSPMDEDCAQVGSDNYYAQVKRECFAYMKQLSKMFPEASEQIITRSFSHDFGSYFEVVICFDDNHPDSVDLAYKVADSIPEHWDDEAKEYLGIK